MIKWIILSCIAIICIPVHQEQQAIFLRYANFENFKMPLSDCLPNWNKDMINLEIGDTIGIKNDYTGIDILKEDKLYLLLNKGGILGMIKSNFSDQMELAHELETKLCYIGKIVEDQYQSYFFQFSINKDKELLESGEIRHETIFRIQMKNDRLISIVVLCYRHGGGGLGWEEKTVITSKNNFDYFTQTLYDDIVDLVGKEEYMELKNAYSLSIKGEVENVKEIKF